MPFTPLAINRPAMVPSPDNTLIAVFSYNRPRELNCCLGSIRLQCPGFAVKVFDDQSDDLRVEVAAKQNGVDFVRCAGGDHRLGGLYRNMQSALDLAIDASCKFLMTIQDDMQFVRPFDAAVMGEYGRIFAGDVSIAEIDPRFVRGDGSQVSRCAKMPAFEWRNAYSSTYADVGLFSIERLTTVGWSFDDGERNNREKARSLALKRVYPFTPIAMHTPFPTTYRRRRRSLRGLLNSGSCRYRPMTAVERATMDERPEDEPPIFRKYVRPDWMPLIDRLRFRLMSDSGVFR